jgi:hypothetical protein
MIRRDGPPDGTGRPGHRRGRFSPPAAPDRKVAVAVVAALAIIMVVILLILLIID